MYFCPTAEPKGQAANILKERRCFVQIPTLPFSVCFEYNHQIQNDFGVLGVDDEKRNKL